MIVQVEVRLFAVFREGRFKKRMLDLPDGSHLGDIVQHLNIPAEAVSLSLINGRHSPMDQALEDKDIVSLFPAVGGG